MSEKYYSLDNILKLNTLYNILFGERSNGKSFAVKYRAIKCAYENDMQKFIYLRRWREDFTSGRAERYFNDMEKTDDGKRPIHDMTNGEYDCISVYRSDIYLAKRDEHGKKKRGKMIGSIIALTGDTHDKSGAYVGYYRIIYEEFITVSGYLPNEVKTFMSVVSTVLRRRKGEVYLVGNTLTRQCPYFREWELINVPNQKIGTIDIYRYKTDEIDEDGLQVIVDISCEYCNNTSGSTKMIFGNKMITSGEWQTDEKPHLPLVYGAYHKSLDILIWDTLEPMIIDVLIAPNKTALLYIRVETRKWTDYDRYDIIIMDGYSDRYNVTNNLFNYPRVREVVKSLYESGKVCYEDNLVGTSFTTLLQNKKIF